MDDGWMMDDDGRMDGLVWFPRLPFPCFSFLCSSSSARSLVVFVGVHVHSARSIPCQENLLLGYAAIPGSAAENWRNTVPEVGAGPFPRGAWRGRGPPRATASASMWRVAAFDLRTSRLGGDGT